MKAHWNWIKGKISKKFFTEIYNYTTIPQYKKKKKGLMFAKAACIWLKTQNTAVILWNIIIELFSVLMLTLKLNVTFSA